MMTARLKSQHGFSLIELLTTITVFALFAVLVGGGITYYSRVTRRVKAEAELVYEMQQAADFITREMRTAVRRKEGNFAYNIFSHNTDAGGPELTTCQGTATVCTPETSTQDCGAPGLCTEALYVLKYTTLTDPAAPEFLAKAIFKDQGKLRVRQCRQLTDTTSEPGYVVGSGCVDGGTWDLTSDAIEITDFKYQSTSYAGFYDPAGPFFRFTLTGQARTSDIPPLTINSGVINRNLDGTFSESAYEL